MMTKPTGKLLFAYNTIASLNERIAELDKDLSFYKCCMKSGENAKDSDAPSQRAKALKEKGNG
jgi:uncharacterized coiled-coil DUF342 family protein